MTSKEGDDTITIVEHSDLNERPRSAIHERAVNASIMAVADWLMAHAHGDLKEFYNPGWAGSGALENAANALRRALGLRAPEDACSWRMRGSGSASFLAPLRALAPHDANAHHAHAVEQLPTASDCVWGEAHCPDYPDHDCCACDVPKRESNP